MENKFTQEIYNKLIEAVEKLPKEAIESAKKEVTRKGYDTTGYQYQYLVNILNEIVGVENWNSTYETDKEIEGKYASGQSYWEITVDTEVEILGVKRRCAGGHKSGMHADAKKGAITNSFKKTVALFGVGKKAYEGTIDEDYRPVAPESDTAKVAQQPMGVARPISKDEPTPEEMEEIDRYFSITGGAVQPPADEPVPFKSADKIKGQLCPQCNKAKIALNPNTGKLFCEDKCWLKK